MASMGRQRTVENVKRSANLASKVVVYMGRAGDDVPADEELAGVAIKLVLAASIESVRLCEAIIRELKVCTKTEADEQALELVLAEIGQGNGGGVG